MNNRNEEKQRFELLKSFRDWNIFYDNESQSVPYIIIEKKKNLPMTTRDLMEKGAVLLSSKKLVKDYFINKNKEKDYESGKHEFK